MADLDENGTEVTPDNRISANRLSGILGIPLAPRPEPTPPPVEEETQYDRLAPGTVMDMIGQDMVRRQMLITLGAARRQTRVAPHILLEGPPGLGKSTIARMVATYMGVRMIETDSLVLSKPSLLVNVLADLRPGDVLFVDEVQRLTKKVAEGLYLAMAEFKINVESGVGRAKTVDQVKIAPFTLVAATTDPGLIPQPLYDRFKFVGQMQYYDTDELEKILEEAAGKYDTPLTLDPDACVDLALRSRGTPRIALTMLEKARDVALAFQQPDEDGNYPDHVMIDMDVVDTTFTMFDIDDAGLTPNDRTVLRDLLIRHGGGPVGINALAATTAIDEVSIRKVIEPWLIRAGFMSRGVTGRHAMLAAYTHLSKSYSDIPQPPAWIRRGWTQ